MRNAAIPVVSLPGVLVAAEVWRRSAPVVVPVRVVPVRAVPVRSVLELQELAAALRAVPRLAGRLRLARRQALRRVRSGWWPVPRWPA